MSGEPDRHSEARQFERLADDRQLSLVEEFVQFLRENKKWWLIPILLVMVLLSVLVVLSTSGAGPFIYTFF